jgi:hypothetical protein
MVSCGHAPVSRLTAAENLENSALRHLARLFPLFACSGRPDYNENGFTAQHEKHLVQ